MATPLILTSRTRGGGYSSLVTFIDSDTQQQQQQPIITDAIALKNKVSK